jgi:hypothetical protein
VLAKLLERLEIGGRFGTELRFHHLVMLHPKAIIQRPDPKRYDTTHVIKADQFSEWRERYVDAAFSGLGALGIALNFRASETVKEWGEKIARQHRPDDLLALPEFMRPKVGLSPAPASSPSPALAPSANTEAAGASEAPAKRLICAPAARRSAFPRASSAGTTRSALVASSTAASTRLPLQPLDGALGATWLARIAAARAATSR